MTDTARRLVLEKYPHVVNPPADEVVDREDVMPSIDLSWQNADIDMQRSAFLAGWNAAIEHAAKISETHVNTGGTWSDGIAAAIRAERSDG